MLQIMMDMDIYAELRDLGYLGVGNKHGIRRLWDWCDEEQKQNMLKEIGYTRIADEIGMEKLWDCMSSPVSKFTHN